MGFFDFLKAKVANSGVDISKRYALLREAVSGTMSKFYKAKDLRTGRVVGLKILDREKTAAFEDRFRGLKKPSEGEMGMLLKHPRLVETLEHGTTTDGSQYIALEFIDGPDFNSLIIARDPVLEGNRVHFVRQAAEAIAAVHAAGFVHRDICPRNFLLADRAKKELKMIDFGLSLPCQPQFQQPGVRTGNPNYMAPEIVRRKPPTSGSTSLPSGSRPTRCARANCLGRGGPPAWRPCRTTSRPPTSFNTGPNSIRNWPRPFIGAWRPNRPGDARLWRNFSRRFAVSRRTG